jgi:hypothetical protein
MEKLVSSQPKSLAEKCFSPYSGAIAGEELIQGDVSDVFGRLW